MRQNADEIAKENLLVAVGTHDIAKIKEVLAFIKAKIANPQDLYVAPLLWAAEIGAIDVVELLLDAGAEVNRPEKKDGCTALLLAAQEGHVAIVRLLLQRGAQVDLARRNGGNTALWMAAQRGRSEVIEVLLQHGAKVDAVDERDVTPLLIAAQKGHTRTVELLLSHGADVNFVDGYQHCCALFIAAQYGHCEIVDLLLRANASVNVTRIDRATPLAVAVDKNHVQIVARLLEAGADCEAQDQDGLTPLIIALSSDYSEIAAMLSKHLRKSRQEKIWLQMITTPSITSASPETSSVPAVEAAAMTPHSGNELVIDLHSFSMEKARLCVLHALATAQNITRIRIITGRGNHINAMGERGVLYKSLRSWLTESSYQDRIAKIFTGDGYYEIYLKSTSAQPNPQLEHVFRDLFPPLATMQVDADQGNVRAQLLYAIYAMLDAQSDKDLQRAFGYLLKAARGGCVDAMVELARCYFTGRGVRLNDEEAVKWLIKAHEMHHSTASLMLGDCYWHGQGVTQKLLKISLRQYLLPPSHLLLRLLRSV